MTIRHALPEDAAALCALAQQLGYAPTESELISLVATLGEGHAVLVAELEGKVVGWIEGVRQRTLTAGDEALICGLVVDEKVRGEGIGRQLVAAAEAWAVSGGAKAMRVRSRVHRERAHRFYLDLGYEEAKRQVVFKKRLGGS